MNKVKQILKSWFIPGIENDHKPNILKNKAILKFAILVLCIKLLVLAFFIYFPNSAYFSVITSQRLTELVNQTRIEHNLPPLTVNQNLNQSSYLKASDIIEKDYFAHTSPQKISPWYWFKKTAYNYQYAGENLAMDFTDAETLYQAWLNSPTHKANILNSKYQEIGIAVITGEFNGKNTTVAVQHFGTQFKQLPPAGGTPPDGGAKPVAKAEPKQIALEEKQLASSREAENEPILTTEEQKVDQTISLIIQDKIKEFENLATNITTKESPKILGILAEKSEKITKQVSLYILLFIFLAVLLNMFIKFGVQRHRIIINTILIVGLLILLLLASGTTLLNTNLNII